MTTVTTETSDDPSTSRLLDATARPRPNVDFVTIRVPSWTTPMPLTPISATAASCMELELVDGVMRASATAPLRGAAGEATPPRVTDSPGTPSLRERHHARAPSQQLSLSFLPRVLCVDGAQLEAPLAGEADDAQSSSSVTGGAHQRPHDNSVTAARHSNLTPTGGGGCSTGTSPDRPWGCGGACTFCASTDAPLLMLSTPCAHSMTTMTTTTTLLRHDVLRRPRALLERAPPRGEPQPDAGAAAAPPQQLQCGVRHQP
ncbi:hypothetical protein STCU_10940 [Strigomonas culicis]|uniref:Uncharacterized protein n=1 Tax=Strigomonas culicis TaxID=28005 RepID=S9TFK5_9TRYP|nr:hypothetical protein STCU_10940 [Strigomonas culicis]|eukprot:EPY16857.1 hypothetical protein STCU_10940 [Strigomonas culicis]